MLSSRPSKSVTKSIIRNLELNGSLEGRPTRTRPELLAGEPAEEEEEDDDEDDDEEDKEDEEEEEAEEVETHKVKKGNEDQSTSNLLSISFFCCCVLAPLGKMNCFKVGHVHIN